MSLVPEVADEGPHENSDHVLWSESHYLARWHQNPRRVNAIGPGLVRTALSEGIWLAPALIEEFSDNAPLAAPSRPTMPPAWSRSWPRSRRVGLPDLNNAFNDLTRAAAGVKTLIQP